MCLVSILGHDGRDDGPGSTKTIIMMKLISLGLIYTLICLFTPINSSALTTTIDAAQRSCFYANVDKRVGFYYSGSLIYSNLFTG